MRDNSPALQFQQAEPAFARDGSGKNYLYDIRRFEMLRGTRGKPRQTLARRGDHTAANQLVTVIASRRQIAKGHAGMACRPEIISEGNVGLMQALNRFEPEKGFRFATYAMWWIRAAIQDYILRSWSLVKIGTTTNQKRLFFKLRTAKSKIAAFESGDLHPDQVTSIARRLNVTGHDVVDMNRRLGGDASLNAPSVKRAIRAGGNHLVDPSPRRKLSSSNRTKKTASARRCRAIAV